VNLVSPVGLSTFAIGYDSETEALSHRTLIRIMGRLISLALWHFPLVHKFEGAIRMCPRLPSRKDLPSFC